MLMALLLEGYGDVTAGGVPPRPRRLARVVTGVYRVSTRASRLARPRVASASGTDRIPSREAVRLLS